MEIRSSSKLRSTNQGTGALINIDIGSGVSIESKNIKLINMHIHDVLDNGVGAFKKAESFEIHGCTIYNNGINRIPAPPYYYGSPAGYGIYSQCFFPDWADRNPPWRKIKNNIIFNAFKGNIHLYHDNESNGAAISNYSIENNFVFNCGANVLTCYSTKNADWLARGNIIVFPKKKSQDVIISNNHSFFSDFPQIICADDNLFKDKNGNTTFTLSGHCLSGNCSNNTSGYKFFRSSGGNIIASGTSSYVYNNYNIKSNYCIYGGSALDITNMENLNLSGNYLFGDYADILIRNYRNSICINQFSKPLSNIFQFDNNIYYKSKNVFVITHNEFSTPCNTIYNYKNTCINGLCDFDNSCNTFSKWKSKFNTTMKPPIDTGSKDSTNSTPHGSWAFSYKNDYERGRAHIMVYNWDSLKTIDLCKARGSTIGQLIPKGCKYRLRNAQDLFGQSAIIHEDSIFKGSMIINMYPTYNPPYLQQANLNGLYYKDSNGEYINRFMPSQSTAPKFATLILDYFPFDATIGVNGNSDSATLYPIFKAPFNPNGFADSLWYSTLTYSWSLVGDTTFHSNQPIIKITKSGKYSLDMKDANCMQSHLEFNNGVFVPSGIERDFEIQNFSVSPNPFHENIRLSFSIPHPENVFVQICDQWGRIIETPLNNTLKQGSYEYELINKSEIAPGIYFIKCRFNDKLISKKIVKQ